jgi:hypothetical protein
LRHRQYSRVDGNVGWFSSSLTKRKPTQDRTGAAIALGANDLGPGQAAHVTEVVGQHRPCMLRPDFMALAVQIDDDPIPHPLELSQFAPLIKIYTKIDLPKMIDEQLKS